MSILLALLALITLLLQLHFFIVELAFVGTSLSVGRNKQSKIPYLKSSLKLSFKEVLVTQKHL